MQTKSRMTERQMKSGRRKQQRVDVKSPQPRNKAEAVRVTQRPDTQLLRCHQCPSSREVLLKPAPTIKIISSYSLQGRKVPYKNVINLAFVIEIETELTKGTNNYF